MGEKGGIYEQRSQRNGDAKGKEVVVREERKKGRKETVCQRGEGSFKSYNSPHCKLRIYIYMYM